MAALRKNVEETLRALARPRNRRMPSHFTRIAVAYRQHSGRVGDDLRPRPIYSCLFGHELCENRHMHQLSRPLRRLAACIALIAGYVDAIGFVGYGGTFVSFMSGNSTRVGAGAVDSAHAAAGLTGLVIAAFVAGVAAGQALGGTRDATRRLRVALLTTASLALAATLPHFVDVYFALLAAAFAMGATNTLFANSPLPVGLTYMTGTLVKLGQSLGQRLRGESAPPMTPYLLHWLALAGGAALGAGAFALWEFSALWAAAIAAGVLAACSIELPLKN